MAHSESPIYMSYRLAGAVSAGRKRRGAAENREEVLARLLKKRAAAHRAGLDDLERIMRDQIEWSLPVQKPDGDELT